MIHDLADRQWDAITRGQITSPTATRYTRRSTRTRRRDVDTLIQTGAPLILYYFAGGQLDWYDGHDATEAWRRVRRDVTTDAPKPRPDGRVVWTAGTWQSDHGDTAVVLTGHC